MTTRSAASHPGIKTCNAGIRGGFERSVSGALSSKFSAKTGGTKKGLTVRRRNVRRKIDKSLGKCMRSVFTSMMLFYRFLVFSAR